MKILNKQHQEIILSFGYPKEDLKQIERALKYTDFELNDEKTTIDKAVEILGIERFLSGICRSAFHWSSVRDDDKGNSIYFNSSKLFK